MIDIIADLEGVDGSKVDNETGVEQDLGENSQLPGGEQDHPEGKSAQSKTGASSSSCWYS